MNEPPTPRPILLPLTEHELVLLNNALNELCHGVRISEGEFHARLGGTKDDLRALLRRVHALVPTEDDQP
jgi:hypothetical protein